MNELIEITVVYSGKAGDTQPGGLGGRPPKKRNTPVPLMTGQTAGGWDWRVDVPPGLFKSQRGIPLRNGRE